MGRARISIKTAPLKFHFLVDGRFSSVFLVSRLHNRVKKFAKLSLPSAEMNFSTSNATLDDSRGSSSFTIAQRFRLACRIVGHRPKEKRKFIELRGSASFLCNQHLGERAKTDGISTRERLVYHDDALKLAVTPGRKRKRWIFYVIIWKFYVLMSVCISAHRDSLQINTNELALWLLSMK